jgi:hypothetical protein
MWLVFYWKAGYISRLDEQESQITYHSHSDRKPVGTAENSNVKVKVTLEQATKAQTMRIGTALLFLQPFNAEQHIKTSCSEPFHVSPLHCHLPSAFWEMINCGAVDRILWMGVVCLVMWCLHTTRHKLRHAARDMCRRPSAFSTVHCVTRLTGFQC